MSPFPSPMESGRLSAKATLRPPLSPPHVMIKAVFFSNFLNKDKKAMGILTPIPLETTTKIMTKNEMEMKGSWNDSKTIMISNPMRMNKMAFNV